MDADNTIGGHRSVSRRGVPVASVSSKRTVAKMAKPTLPPKKDSNHGIEMRSLLKAGGASETMNISPNAETSAKQFADSWVGSMIKLKAKQAEKHAYNLRAKFRSKKGFHVQMPKRIIFYTVLVFLVLPLTLFMYKENHIHDHDPGHNFTTKEGNHSHVRGYHHKGTAGGKHNSLQQLLGGSGALMNASDNSSNISHTLNRKEDSTTTEIERLQALKVEMISEQAEEEMALREQPISSEDSVRGSSNPSGGKNFTNRASSGTGLATLNSASSEPEDPARITQRTESRDSALSNPGQPLVGYNRFPPNTNSTFMAAPQNRDEVPLNTTASVWQDHVTHDEERRWRRKRRRKHE